MSTWIKAREIEGLNNAGMRSEVKKLVDEMPDDAIFVLITGSDNEDKTGARFKAASNLSGGNDSLAEFVELFLFWLREAPRR